MADGEFTVWQFFPDETYEAALRHVDAETAVEKARELTLRPAAKIGIISKITIVDGGDFTNFEWRFGQGVVYPVSSERPVLALVQTLEYPTDEHVKAVCKVGQGAACCKYLTMGGGGWSCEKLSPLNRVIDARTDMHAKGDNCAGLGSRQ